MSKVAFIFFGQVKNFDEKQYFSFEQNVKKQIEGNDVDYFLITSKSCFYFNSRQADAELEPKPINYKSIQKYFEFKEIFYDQDLRNKEENICDLAKQIIKFGKAWKDGDCLDSVKKSLKQIYSLEYFINSFTDRIDDYDYFILSRSDLFFTHPLSLECLKSNEDLFAPYYNICPQIDYGWFGGINDRFAIIKNKKALNSYCTRYSDIKNKPEYYHAEKYLLSKLKKDNISYGKINNFMFLMQRADGSLSDLVGTKKEMYMDRELEGVSKSYFINLDRRSDRLFHMYKNTEFSTQRVSAIDAKKIELSDEVKKLFPKTWQSRSKAEICCALSHYRLWEKLVQDENAANYLILEDDAVFKDGFVNFWNQVFSKQIPSDYSIIYFGGCQPWNKPQYPKVLERYNDYFCRIKRNDFFTKDDHFWHMNASSYVLSKTAASLLCQWVERNGMDDALDNFMQRFFNKNKLFAAPKSIYHLNPLMAYQLHEENDNIEIDKNSDLRYAEEKFEEEKEKNSILGKNIKETNFPNLINISNKQIPKKIHLSWKNKNVLDSNYSLIKKGAKNLELLNPDWDIEVNDDEDINKLLRDTIGRRNWDLIKDRKITEKTDLWRLIKTYKEGGVYVDIDRYIDTPLSEIINGETAMFLPTFQDIDFSQDLILTCPKNPIIGKAIANNLNYRLKGESLFFLAVQSYMHSVSEILTGKVVDRRNNPEYFNSIRKKIEACEYLKTFREIGPGYHALYRNISGNFDMQTFEKDKADFYNGESVRHWNTDTQIKHNQFRNINKRKLVFLQKDLFEEDFILELFEEKECEKVFDLGMEFEQENSIIIYSDIYCKNINLYPEKHREFFLQRNEELKQYFNKCKNCILIHLSDEHCHADIDHYKNFKHVFRQYYRSDAVADNVTFMPLGYKKGFKL